MKTIEAPSELLSLLAGELGAGRPVDIPGLGRFSVIQIHAEMENTEEQTHITPPARSVRFESERKETERGD